jgi:hypothetical protein
LKTRRLAVVWSRSLQWSEFVNSFSVFFCHGIIGYHVTCRIWAFCTTIILTDRLHNWIEKRFGIKQAFELSSGEILMFQFPLFTSVSALDVSIPQIAPPASNKQRKIDFEMHIRCKSPARSSFRACQKYWKHAEKWIFGRTTSTNCWNGSA